MRALIALCLLASPAAAECDDPPAAAARDALRTGDFGLVAAWVKPAQEPALQAAFRQARDVRLLTSDSRELADTYFVERAAALHREAYPCIDGPARALADRGDEAEIVDTVVAKFRDGVRARLREIATRRAQRRGDLDAARAAVAGYVDLVSYVATVYAAVVMAPPRSDEPIRHEP